jgi:dTDP-4-amino-4,6-dideoxygalactose transaminase
MIPLIDLKAQYRSIQVEIDTAIHEVLESGQFILGPTVRSFEEKISTYLGVKHAIGVASGTDALVLALRSLDIGPGDEVIVPAYTFFATAGTVMSVGATPVFVDIEPETYTMDVNQLERSITSKTKAMIPVHLYGHPAEMKSIISIAQKYGFKIIEDNAQAFGAEYHGRKTGSLGDIGCLSFYPTKNLGAYGDGGMVVTDNPAIAERVQKLRTHGWKKKYYSEEVGYNSRLDALQAAILQVKLKYVDTWNAQRHKLAQLYSDNLKGVDGLVPPTERPGNLHVYHLYVVRVPDRDRVQATLKETGVVSEVYYPIPPHLATACRVLGYKEGDFPQAESASLETLALPFFPEMGENTIQKLAVFLANTLN